jgi:hypothetical protein
LPSAGEICPIFARIEKAALGVQTNIAPGRYRTGNRYIAWARVGPAVSYGRYPGAAYSNDARGFAQWYCG